MTPEPLNEREFELINIIGQKLGSNQRDLSQQLNLSLGQTNMLIRRLVSKGYIRITQLNQKKMKYILTPKGLAEKMQKSVKYTLNTINAIGLIKNRLAAIFSQLHGEGFRQFYLYGEHDFSTIVQVVFNELNFSDAVLNVVKDLPADELNGVLLIGKEKVKADHIKAQRCLDLIVEMSK